MWSKRFVALLLVSFGVFAHAYQGAASDEDDEPEAAAVTVATTTSPKPAAPVSSVITTRSITPSVKLCNKRGLTCLDCKILQYCDKIGAPQPLFNITCSDQTGKASPYCDENTEECTKINTCTRSSIPTKLAECESAGIRPDPTDCTQYIQCIEGVSSTGYVGYPVNCPIGLKYSHADGKCISTVSCPTMAAYCVGKVGKLVSFKPFPSIYAFCPPVGEPVMKMCQGQYEFVEAIGNCQPACTKAGPIPSNDDCHQYYWCDSTGFTFSLILNSCPAGFGFNPETGLCDGTKANCISKGRVARHRREVSTLSSTSFWNIL